jgi:hypothetical protein
VENISFQNPNQIPTDAQNSSNKTKPNNFNNSNNPNTTGYQIKDIQSFNNEQNVQMKNNQPLTMPQPPILNAHPNFNTQKSLPNPQLPNPNLPSTAASNINKK